MFLLNQIKTKMDNKPLLYVLIALIFILAFPVISNAKGYFILSYKQNNYIKKKSCRAFIRLSDPPRHRCNGCGFRSRQRPIELCARCGVYVLAK